jgi:hypothetical protein
MVASLAMNKPVSSAAAGPARDKDYAVRAADLHEDRKRVLDVWRGMVASQPEAKYEWFYQRHPYRSPTLLILTHGCDNVCIGVAGLGTRKVCVQGFDATAGVLVDLMVQREHRTLYPALLLQKKIQATALGQHRIVYGFPNRNAAPIVRRLGYIKVGDLVRYSKVLRHAPFLERRGVAGHPSKALGAVADLVTLLYFRPYRAPRTSCRVSWESTVDARFDALWQRARSFDGLIGVRDAQFLSWRFLSQPGHRYLIFVMGAQDSVEIVAYAVCEDKGNSLHVRDFLVDPACTGGVRLLFHLLSNEARAKGYENLSFAFLGPARVREELVAAGFMPRETQPLYATFNAQDEARLHKLEWYATNADEDQ